MSSKIVYKVWFTIGNQCIGLIITENELTKERRACIGTCSGDDETKDANQIKECGASVLKDLVRDILNHM